MKFRKKPIVIEAREYRVVDAPDIARWCGGRVIDVAAPLGVKPWVRKVAIDTLEGTMYADPGDWIIRGVAGEFYPCKPDIFVSTYEPVR